MFRRFCDKTFSFLLHFSLWKIPKQTTIEKDEYFEIIMTAIYRWGPSSMRTLFSGLKKYLLAVTDEFSFSPTSSKDYPVITINDHLFEPILCFIFFIYATSKMLGWDEWSNERLLLRQYKFWFCFLLAKKMALNNQLQKYLRHFTLFWLNWPVHYFLLVIPPPRSPYQVLVSIRCRTKLKTWRNNLEWRVRRKVSIISHGPVTRRDLN